MIFRTSVMVACAVPDRWSDAVEYTFGVNAADASEALRFTMEAAKHAVDRDGHYIGGVIFETACRCACPDEFRGAERHFHRPMSEPGIFYVTGVTYTSVSAAIRAELAADLAVAKERIALSGTPPPSFAHPQLSEDPPAHVRLVCSVCGHWVQVSNAGLLYSFMSGLEANSPEAKEASAAAATASPFVHRHLVHCGGTIDAAHVDDARWSKLDEGRREDEDDQRL